MNGQFWRGRRVLVTGHTGFKGSWLTAMLHRMGATVTGFALDPETPSLFEISGLAGALTDLRGDVRRAKEVEAAVDRADAEVVFHLAAQSLVRRSYDQPVETFDANVMGTVHLLDALRRSPTVRAVVVVTSDKCYENHGEGRRFQEGDRLGGEDPYSASKACAELAVGAYRRSFFGATGCRIASARAGNVVGGGDFAPDRLVPDAMRAFGAGSPLTLRYPEAVRPWQHVLEPLTGYMTLAEAMAGHTGFDQPWNFGPGEDALVSVREVADELTRLWGGGAAWRLEGDEQPKEAMTLSLDSGKAGALLGWRPRLTLSEALRMTVDFHRALAAGADAGELMEGDIAAYEAKGSVCA